VCILVPGTVYAWIKGVVNLPDMQSVGVQDPYVKLELLPGKSKP